MGDDGDIPPYTQALARHYCGSMLIANLPHTVKCLSEATIRKGKCQWGPTFTCKVFKGMFLRSEFRMLPFTQSRALTKQGRAVPQGAPSE